MFLKEIVLEGFKSYATRTVVSGFDPAFNAITGLNGSGKSNILDSICFVLGISNLTQVRCSNLQELVYKQGQGGVNKATVTLLFDNADKAGSPVGYEDFDEITVTRQIVIGGRNKYLINGHNAQQSRVQNLFHSVQLNVNNPHFLIMQGRITKVLNMKPPEILAMIEEAAGTRMFEMKKQAALKTMEKKEAKVSEINKVLAEEINPTLEKLRKDKSSYLQWSSINAEVERLDRFVIAFQFQSAAERVGESEEKRSAMEKERDELEAAGAAARAEVKEADEEIERLMQDREGSMESEYKELETQVGTLGKELVAEQSLLDHAKEERDADVATLGKLETSVSETEAAIARKKTEVEKVQQQTETVRETSNSLVADVTRMTKEYEALCTGISSDGDAKGSTADQLMEAKKAATVAVTEAKQHAVKMEHLRKELAALGKSAKAAESEAAKFTADVSANARAAEEIEARMEKLAFDPSAEKKLLAERKVEQAGVAKAKETVETLSAQLSALEFVYTDPTKDFDRSKVKGLVANLIRVADPRTATALEVTAGGKLFQVVVDSDTTGKQLLSNGKLRRRVTIIPLNKINDRVVKDSVMQRAKALAGDEAKLALELVGYEDEVQAAMKYVFGNTIVCENGTMAKKLAFDPDVRTKAVTLEGDVLDPSGTLTGGSRPSQGSVLARLQRLNEARDKLVECQERLARVEGSLNELMSQKASWSKLSQELDLKRHAVSLAEDRQKASAHHQLVEKFAGMQREVDSLSERVDAAKAAEKAANARCAELENQLAEGSSDRDSTMKKMESGIAAARKQLAKAEAETKKKEQELQTLTLEIEQLEADLTAAAEAIVKAKADVGDAETKVDSMAERVASKKHAYAEAKAALDERKAALAARDKEVGKLTKERARVAKKVTDKELELKKFEHTLSRFEKEQADAERLVDRMMEEFPWIRAERQFFGQPHTDYDFAGKNANKAQQRLTSLREQQSKLGKSINKKVMSMFEKAEAEYQDLMGKKNQIVSDKAKIESVISELDEKKNDALTATWEKVNKDFGKMFATLLPGTSAKLDPPEGLGVLDGLEIKVAFGGVWKESLTELSGGQRSLCALSLILALLLFKPAPMYILDEVDAALDLSHTQNIGQLLKEHFQQSQFIVVSLKEGMFNNANVLFKTKFVDGVSTVSQTSNVQQASENAGGRAATSGKAAQPAKKRAALASRN